jgi:MFS family permease
MSQKIPRRVILGVILLTLSGEIAWAVENQYFNVFIYSEIAPVPIYVSLMVSITAAVSTFTTFFLGAYSDIKARRRIFLIVGYVFWVITTAIFPFSADFKAISIGFAIFIAILFDSIMSFFGAMSNDAVLNAYVTDVTIRENRGRLSSIKELMFLVALLIVYALSGYIIDAINFFNYFFLIAGIVAILGIPGALIIPEPKNLIPNKIGYWKTIKETFSFKLLRENHDFTKIQVSGALFWIAFNVFFPFIIIYLEYGLSIPAFEASILIFIALLISIILAVPMGIVTDKIGRKKVAIGAVIIEIVGLFFFSFSRGIEDFVYIAFTSSLWVFGMISFNVATRTWLKDLYPEDKRGQTHGYYLLFTILGGMTIGSLLGGFIAGIFGTPYTSPEGVPGSIPPALLFMIASFMMILSLIPILLAKEYRKKA